MYDVYVPVPRSSILPAHSEKREEHEYKGFPRPPVGVRVRACARAIAVFLSLSPDIIERTRTQPASRPVRVIDCGGRTRTCGGGEGGGRGMH